METEPGRRKPYVATLENPDRPDFEVIDDDTGEITTIHRGFPFIAVASDGLPGQVNDIALCHVRVDSQNGTNVLVQDPQVVDLLEEGIDPALRLAYLNSTPRTEKWNQKKLDNLKKKLERYLDRNGLPIDVSDLTLDTTIREILRKVGVILSDTFNPEDNLVY